MGGRLFGIGVCLGLALALGCKPAATPKSEPKTTKDAASAKAAPTDRAAASKLSAREVLDRMAETYRKATSYADAGEVRLLAEAGREKVIDQTAPFSMTMVRPNKIRMQSQFAVLVCDGTKLFAAVEGQPDQVLERPAPTKMTPQTMFADQVLAGALMQGLGGPMPQIALLLVEDPIAIYLQDADPPTLSEPGQIAGDDCYRVQIKRQDGVTTFWIDQKTFLLRRMVMPTDELLREIREQQPVDHVSLVAEFSGARIDAAVGPKAFEFEAPASAKAVKFFVPPDIAQQLGKKASALKFTDLNGKPVTLESLAGKVTVLDFWATYCGWCRRSLPELDKVREPFKNNPKVAFYAVSVDLPKVENKTLAKFLDDLKVHLPIVRDVDQTVASALKVGGASALALPITLVLGPDGVIQDGRMGYDPKLAEELPAKIDQLLAGRNVYEKPLKEYQEKLARYAEMLERAYAGESPAIEPAAESQRLPEVKTAPRSEPTRLKLSPWWKSAEVKSPGNILVISDRKGGPRLAVVDGWKSVAEVGLDGKLIARHKMNLGEEELIANLRSAVGADGRRYTVAFFASQQRCHVLDENWNHVVSYPEDALKNPHRGIASVELGDLDGDGRLKLYVSYWGVVGVQAASLEGRRIWSNRSVLDAASMAVGEPDAKGRRNLYCTSNNGSLAVLNAEGRSQSEVKIPGCMLRWIAAADLRRDGRMAWCGLSSPQLGDNLAVGVSLKGEELWRYVVTPGVQPSPIEPIVPGQVARSGAGQWILPGPDGSVHFLDADGKLFDKFNSGVKLHGLATVVIDGQPVLILASPEGLQAWRIE
ncbi:MAG: redoxin domain-containing protein [Thermoguttaceae bacterium]